MQAELSQSINSLKQEGWVWSAGSLSALSHMYYLALHFRKSCKLFYFLLQTFRYFLFPRHLRVWQIATGAFSNRTGMFAFAGRIISVGFVLPELGGAAVSGAAPTSALFAGLWAVDFAHTWIHSHLQEKQAWVDPGDFVWVTDMGGVRPKEWSIIRIRIFIYILTQHHFFLEF